jgi:hypothetical protein
MTIANTKQLENTRTKLKLLEEEHARLKSERTENAYTRQLTLQALQRWIKELKEEIVRYELHQRQDQPGPGSLAENSRIRQR